LNDVDVLIKESKKLYPELPQFIYGHSLGGNIVTNYILKRENNFVGAVISSPWYQLAFDPSAFSLLLARVIKRIFPKFTQNAKLDVKGLSHDQDLVSKYLNDPLVHEKISVRMFFEIYNAGQWVLHNPDKLNIPTLLQHGTGDSITSYKASKEFFDKAKSQGKDIEYKAWEGLYHELHNEVERDEIFEYVNNWLNRKLKRR
jgi:alpha-beta hydrolase superfamily lysophospholipase